MGADIQGFEQKLDQLQFAEFQYQKIRSGFLPIDDELVDIFQLGGNGRGIRYDVHHAPRPRTAHGQPVRQSKSVGQILRHPQQTGILG